MKPSQPQTPLLADDALSLREFTRGLVDRFRRDVEERLERGAGAP